MLERPELVTLAAAELIFSLGPIRRYPHFGKVDSAAQPRRAASCRQGIGAKYRDRVAALCARKRFPANSTCPSASPKSISQRPAHGNVRRDRRGQLWFPFRYASPHRDADSSQHVEGICES